MQVSVSVAMLAQQRLNKPIEPAPIPQEQTTIESQYGLLDDLREGTVIIAKSFKNFLKRLLQRS